MTPSDKEAEEWCEEKAEEMLRSWGEDVRPEDPQEEMVTALKQALSKGRELERERIGQSIKDFIPYLRHFNSCMGIGLLCTCGLFEKEEALIDKQEQAHGKD